MWVFSPAKVLKVGRVDSGFGFCGAAVAEGEGVGDGVVVGEGIGDGVVVGVGAGLGVCVGSGLGSVGCGAGIVGLGLGLTTSQAIPSRSTSSFALRR